jgi:hypothetical protein
MREKPEAEEERLESLEAEREREALYCERDWKLASVWRGPLLLERHSRGSEREEAAATEVRREEKQAEEAMAAAETLICSRNPNPQKPQRRPRN